MKVMTEETFGPVIPVMAFADEAEVPAEGCTRAGVTSSRAGDQVSSQCHPSQTRRWVSPIAH